MRTDSAMCCAICSLKLDQNNHSQLCYFGQGTNHRSLPLLRACRLVPLGGVSSLRTAAEGNEKERFPFLACCIFFALLYHQEIFILRAVRKDITFLVLQMIGLNRSLA